MKPWFAELAAIVLLATPLSGAPVTDARLEAGLQAIIDEDAHIAAIAFRLTTGAGPLCPVKGYQTGFVLQARDQYAPWLRETAIRRFGLDEHVAISAIAVDSPAERAGLAIGDKVLAVGGKPLSLAPMGKDGSYATVGAAVSAIDAELPSGTARFEIERGGERRTLSLDATPGCAVHVQLWPSSLLNAFADDHYATMTTALARAADNDDELAVLMAHEIAHSVLHHEAWLDARAPARRVSGPSATPADLVLQTEREADRFGLYLAARAGFDIARAEGIWTKLRVMRGPAIWLTKTHPGAREREATLSETADEIARKKAAGEPLVP